MNTIRIPLNTLYLFERITVCFVLCVFLEGVIQFTRPRLEESLNQFIFFKLTYRFKNFIHLTMLQLGFLTVACSFIKIVFHQSHPMHIQHKRWRGQSQKRVRNWQFCKLNTAYTVVDWEACWMSMEQRTGSQIWSSSSSSSKHNI